MQHPVDVVDGRRPGGANTSHTIAVGHLTNLLGATQSTATAEAYESIAVERNVLGRSTYEGRRRTFRYLRELYLLDPDRLLFRGLRDLWDEDPVARPQLAGLSALARDSSFRASAETVLPARAGELVRPDDIAREVDRAFPATYNAATLHKIGRNAASSWTQTGHLAGRTHKTRADFRARLVSAVYAAFIGHLAGYRGEEILATIWARYLCLHAADLSDMLRTATQNGYLEFRSGGGVVEFGFSHLLRPIEGVIA